MLNHKEIMEALIAGETLRSQQLTYSSEIHLTKEGKLSSGSFEMFNRIPPEQWDIKPKEPEGWENIPKRGVLVKDVFDNIVRITATNNPRRWILLTNEEIEAFKR
jgi:hypothetical protein